MTLKEFINKTLIEEGLVFEDVSKIEDHVTDVAREKAKNGLTILDNDEVKELIIQFVADPDNITEKEDVEKKEEDKKDGKDKEYEQVSLEIFAED